MSRPAILATVVSLLALSACALPGHDQYGRPLAQQTPPTAYAAQPSPPPATAPVSPVADRSGGRVERFRGPFDGGTATVTLTPQAGGRTALRLTTRSPNFCEQDGTQIVSTQALNGAGAVIQANSAAEGVYFRRTANGLTMEQKGAGYSRCFFSGDLTRF